MNIKYFMLLQKYIKRITQDYIINKPDIFLFSKIKLGLTTLFYNENNKNLLCKVSISIICFGVLRHIEILLIEIKDKKFYKLANIEFYVKQIVG